MCFDPWEFGIYDFANRYMETVAESQNPRRSEQQRMQWAGKAEFFALSYPDKLRDLDDDELNEWLDDIVADWSEEDKERLLEPAEAELKRRAKESANVGSE